MGPNLYPATLWPEDGPNQGKFMIPRNIGILTVMRFQSMLAFGLELWIYRLHAQEALYTYVLLIVNSEFTMKMAHDFLSIR